MTRTYQVTLAQGTEHYAYRVSVDDEQTAREAAILRARVLAAADYNGTPYSFALWSCQEVDDDA